MSEARQYGKEVRKQLASAICEYVRNHETEQEINQALKWYYSTVTDTIYINLFRRKAEQLIADWGCRNPRDVMSEAELQYIIEAEMLVSRLIVEEAFEPIHAALEATRRVQLPVVVR